jgi:hypothetical protein
MPTKINAFARLAHFAIALVACPLAFAQQGVGAPASPSGSAAFILVSTLPTAAAATIHATYIWTAATLLNTCPASGAGGSGGSVTATCRTDNNSTWIAVVATDGTGNVPVGNTLLALTGFPATLQTAHVTLSAAQVAGLNPATGVVIIPAVAGKTVLPVWSYTILHAGTTPYTFGSLDYGLGLSFANADTSADYSLFQVFYPAFPNTHDQGAIGGDYYSYYSTANGVGQALDLFNLDGSWAGGDGTLDIWPLYGDLMRLLTFALIAVLIRTRLKPGARKIKPS